MWPQEAEPMQQVWVEKGKEKAEECFPSVCARERVADVKLHHHTAACEVAASQTRTFGAEQG